MRKLLFSIGTLLYTVTCMGTSKKELPNILFLLVDDMQRTCIHHNGCEQVSTPNIDRIYQMVSHFILLTPMARWEARFLCLVVP